MSQHTKLTPEKNVLPSLLPGFEHTTFRSRVRRSNQQAICLTLSPGSSVPGILPPRRKNSGNRGMEFGVLSHRGMHQREKSGGNVGDSAVCSGHLSAREARSAGAPKTHHHHQSLNREGRWGTTDDFATSFPHFPLFSTALWDLPYSRPVPSLMLSSHLFLCLSCLLPPFTVPC